MTLCLVVGRMKDNPNQGKEKKKIERARDNREVPRHPWPVVAADNALVSLLPAYHLHLS